MLRTRISAAAKKSNLQSQVRHGHGLVVPYVHTPLSKFTKDLVPEEQVRELNQFEQKPWEFWSSSTALHHSTPITRGVVSVPAGEAWIVERLGSYNRTLTSGTGFLLPFVEKVKAVKTTTINSMGFVVNDVQTKSGASVDAYGTALYRVVDPKTSAYYLDPETNKADSERAAARVLRKALAAAVADVSASSLSSDLKTQVGAKVLESIKKREAELGLAFDLVEIRGAFPVAENVPVKIRAFETPYPDLEGPGHDLSADYWNDVLTPPYFQKVTHGSNLRPITPVTFSMEWNIPSPPDFHHFNMQPKVAVAPEEEELKKLGHSGHH